MILEITPVCKTGYSTPTKQLTAWLKGPIVYSVALVVSTTIMGGLIGFIGDKIPLTRGGWLIGVGLIALAYGLHELSWIRLPIPQIKWQVPASWSILYGKTGQSVLYGLVLGADFFTLIPFTSFYILILLEAYLGLFNGALIGLVYGFSRVISTQTAMVYLLRIREVSMIIGAIYSKKRLIHRVNGVVLLVIGEFLLATALF